MKINSRDNITKYIIIIPIVFIVLLSLIILYLSINSQKTQLDNILKEKRISFVNYKKQTIKNQVDQILSLIKYKLSSKKIPMNKTKELLSNQLSTIRFDNKGYIYVVDGSGKIVSHRNKNIVGTNSFLIKDTNNKFYFKDGYEISKKNSSAFIEYISVTNEDKLWNNRKKLTYVKYCKQLDWAISAGIYFSDMEVEIALTEAQLKDEYYNNITSLIKIVFMITLLIIILVIFLLQKVSNIIIQKENSLNNQIDNKSLKLKENILFFDKLLNTVPIPIFIKDKDFKYTKCNDAFCRFLNLTQDEIIGKSVYDLASKELADTYHKKDKELLTINNQYYKYEIQTSNNANKKVVEFYKTSYEHKHKFAGIIGVIIDITLSEQKKELLKKKVAEHTEENLFHLQQYEEEQLNNIKFTAIGQLAAGMTHEINTPLTYIKGNFEMMKYDIEDLPESNVRDRMLEDASKITDGIHRLSNIVESMREMSQKSKESKESTNIYHTLVTSLTLIFNRAKHISKIKLNGEDFHIGISKDKEVFISCIQKQRIEQVWVVIVNNALDELLKIEDYEHRLIDISIEYSSDKKYIVVKIKDNAKGINDNILDSIFEPFISSKESSGMGVGLNIAKKIIDEQDGQILAYNENDGAVFEINLHCGECDL